MRWFLLQLSFAIASVFAMACVDPAHAEITITEAQYAAGVLVVRGETSRANQRVTLDRRYRTRTNRFNEFRFRIRYLPPDCSVTIRAGRDIRPARIANCEIILRGMPYPKKSGYRIR
jgi:hypothetical protein